MQTSLRGRSCSSTPCAAGTSGRGAPVLVQLGARGAHSRRSVVLASTAPSKQAPHGKVVCVGEALFDLIADQKGVPREKVKSWTPYAGGAPCNVATSLARLGLDVTFISALGKDERGEALMKLCKERGVKLHAVQRRDEPTRDVYVVRDEAGDREFAGFGLPTEQYSDCFIDKALLPMVDLKKSALLVTGTLGLAYPATAESLRACVEAAKAGGATVLVDVNWRPVFWRDTDAAKQVIMDYLQCADLIKLSDQDLEALLGVNLSTALVFPCTIAEKFPNARGVLVTAGEEGAAYCFKSPAKGEHSGFVPTFKVKVADTTGAGDAFTAGFVYKLLQAGGLDALAANPQALKDAVVFASAAGAYTCTRPGAIEGQPSLEEAEALYKQSHTWYNFW